VETRHHVIKIKRTKDLEAVKVVGATQTRDKAFHNQKPLF